MIKEKNSNLGALFALLDLPASRALMTSSTFSINKNSLLRLSLFLSSQWPPFYSAFQPLWTTGTANGRAIRQASHLLFLFQLFDLYPLGLTRANSVTVRCLIPVFEHRC